MNPDWGVLTNNAVGEERQTLFATYLSGPNGLTKSDTIAVFGLFPLVTPSGPLTNGYGLQVRDVSGAATIAELEVQPTTLALLGLGLAGLGFSRRRKRS
jgi:hypothetical protein